MGRRPKYTQVQKIKNDLTDAFNRANGIEAAEIFGMLFEVLNEQKAKITPAVVVAEPEPVVSIESTTSSLKGFPPPALQDFQRRKTHAF